MLQDVFENKRFSDYDIFTSLRTVRTPSFWWCVHELATTLRMSTWAPAGIFQEGGGRRRRVVGGRATKTNKVDIIFRRTEAKSTFGQCVEGANEKLFFFFCSFYTNFTGFNCERRRYFTGQQRVTSYFTNSRRGGRRPLAPHPLPRAPMHVKISQVKIIFFAKYEPLRNELIKTAHFITRFYA